MSNAARRPFLGLSRVSRTGRVCVSTALLAASLLGMAARAEVPPMSDAAMQSAAELIATGIVTGVSEKDETSYPARGQKLVTGTWTITIDVEAVEKGRLAPGETAVRFTGERNVAVPKGWLGGTNTLRLTPQPGDEVKAYLVSESGGWRLIHHLGLWIRR